MKYVKIISVFLIFTVILSGSYFALQFYYLNDIYDVVEREPLPGNNATTNGTTQPDGTSSFLNYEYKEKNARPFTVLLLGTDSDNLNAGRTDTIVLAVVDPKTDKINLLSFPRDTRVEIAGKGKFDKINHSFNYGVSTTIATVEHYLQIPVDYYMSVNLNGFVDLVDELGGVTLDVEKNMQFYDRLTKQQFMLSAGKQHLTGTQALNYARFRSDGEGDFGRNRRQRQVITAMIDQSINFRNVSKITDIFKILGNNARTDLSLNQIVKMAIQLNGANGDSVETIEMKGYPSNIGGISYVEISEEEHERVKELLATMLQGEKTN